MTDIKSAKDRSRNMAAIRSKDTTPEVYIRKLLFSRKYRYRKNVSYTPGHPDLFLRKFNLAVFVHGCFWHRHRDCKYAYMPRSREDFWQKKFDQNIVRDAEVLKELDEQGIRCLIIWECTIKAMRKDKEVEESVMTTIDDFIQCGGEYLEI